MCRQWEDCLPLTLGAVSFHRFENGGELFQSTQRVRLAIGGRRRGYFGLRTYLVGYARIWGDMRDRLCQPAAFCTARRIHWCSSTLGARSGYSAMLFKTARTTASVSSA